MNATTSTGLVQQFIQRTERLYSLPAVAVEVLRLTSEPRVDARALRECIERDPALTTRILRVVNSSLFAASRQVSDLNQALSLLGTRPLKMLVLGFSLPKELFSGIEANVLGRFWRRTLTKATAARELAQRLWHVSGDEAFTAGLVQDIGVLALVQQLGQSYLDLLNLIQDRGGSVLEQEFDTLGFDHGILGARLLAHWGLPAPLCAAVATPPDEAAIDRLEPAERTLPQILHLAELLVQLLEHPYGPALRQLLEIGGRYRGLDYESLRPIVAVLQQQVTELADVLALELPAGQEYADLLIVAQQRMADETALVAAELLSGDPESDLLQVVARLRCDLAAAAGTTTVMVAPRTVAPPPDSRTAHPATTVQTIPPRAADATIARACDIAGDPSLVGLLSGAAHRCRQSRCSISLALFAIDRDNELLLRLGPTQAADAIHRLRLSLSDWTGWRSPATLVSDSCFALIWEDCPRSEALELVRQVLSRAREWHDERPGNSLEMTLSAGLATLEVPPRNFQPHQLIDAAWRCLSGAQLSGGDTLKSIAF